MRLRTYDKLIATIHARRSVVILRARSGRTPPVRR
jgi:hypothetical protein